MGLQEWWNDLQKERQENAVVRRHKEAMHALDQEELSWREEQSALEKELHIARDPACLVAHPDVTIPVILHKNEGVRLVAAGAALVEPKHVE
jgi:hypothetical protein